MFTIAVASTKGGVGKTTIAANLGGLLADTGSRVLLIADVQPSLSSYYAMLGAAAHGLTRMCISGALTPDCISEIELSSQIRPAPAGCLHIVVSDTANGKLQDWMADKIDTLFRIKMAIRSVSLEGRYDIAIIDTQGAVGHLQDAAINAADMIISPASPDMISAREFVRGTMKLLERHESVAALGVGFTVPPMKAVINRTENTIDSRVMAEHIRSKFLDMRGKVSVLETTLPSIVAYRKAATARVPVHWIDPGRASALMHSLMWELIPEFHGKCAPGFIPSKLNK